MNKPEMRIIFYAGLPMNTAYPKLSRDPLRVPVKARLIRHGFRRKDKPLSLNFDLNGVLGSGRLITISDSKIGLIVLFRFFTAVNF